MLSNFNPCKFHYRCTSYLTYEQSIQHQKAILSKNKEIAEAIMKTDDPGEAKNLSRCIAKTDEWNNMVKQNEDLCLAVHNRILSIIIIYWMQGINS